MDLIVHNTVMLIKFSKQIANSFVKITNCWRSLEIIRGELKSLSNIKDGAFLRSRKLFPKIIKSRSLIVQKSCMFEKVLNILLNWLLQLKMFHF